MRDNLSIVAVTYLETVLYILNNPQFVSKKKHSFVESLKQVIELLNNNTQVHILIFTFQLSFRLCNMFLCSYGFIGKNSLKSLFSKQRWAEHAAVNSKSVIAA